MEQWIGTHCYMCFVATARTLQNGRIQNCLIFCIKEVAKDRFQYCQNSDGFIHYMRAIQGHSGGNNVDPSLPAPIINTQHSDLFFPCAPQQRLLFGRFTEQFPLTGQTSQDKRFRRRDTVQRLHNQSWTSRRCRGESVLDFGMR